MVDYLEYLAKNHTAGHKTEETAIKRVLGLINKTNLPYTSNLTPKLHEGSFNTGLFDEYH